MFKNLLIILVSFVTVFFNQSQVWAIKNTENIQKIVTLDNPMFFTYESPYMTSEKIEINDSDSKLWVGSIFITGLGQILMGNTFTGVTFFLTQTVLVVSSIYTITTNSGAGFIGFSGWASSIFITPIILLFLGVSIIYLHIWNIADAYNISQEKPESSDLNENYIGKLEKKLKISNKGDISFIVFTF